MKWVEDRRNYLVSFNNIDDRMNLASPHLLVNNSSEAYSVHRDFNSYVTFKGMTLKTRTTILERAAIAKYFLCLV